MDNKLSKEKGKVRNNDRQNTTRWIGILYTNISC
jgi:hypothetical protein